MSAYLTKLSDIPECLKKKLENGGLESHVYHAIATRYDGKKYFFIGYENVEALDENGNLESHGRSRGYVLATTEFGYSTYLYLDGEESYSIEELEGPVSEIFEKYGDVYVLSELPKNDFPEWTTNREKAKFYERAFFKSYGNLFKKGDLTQSLMGFGFGVGFGWYPILMTVFETISKRLREEPEMFFEFVQIKEKYGGLRLYFYGGDDSVNQVVAWAESKSERVCENCGKPATPTDLGWVFTLCKECVDKRKKGEDLP